MRFFSGFARFLLSCTLVRQFSSSCIFIRRFIAHAIVQNSSFVSEVSANSECVFGIKNVPTDLVVVVVYPTPSER